MNAISNRQFQFFSLRRAQRQARLLTRGRLAKDPVELNRLHSGGAMGIESRRGLSKTHSSEAQVLLR